MSQYMNSLVVDSDQVFRESVANLLLACGVKNIEMASTMEEARERVARNYFDIIFVEIALPHMSGLDFAQKLRQQTPKTKIILLIEDQQLANLNETRRSEWSFPTLLKSFAHDTLPQLLADDANSIPPGG